MSTHAMYKAKVLDVGSCSVVAQSSWAERTAAHYWARRQARTSTRVWVVGRATEDGRLTAVEPALEGATPSEARLAA
jgi:hypothetical protein